MSPEHEPAPLPAAYTLEAQIASVHQKPFNERVLVFCDATLRAHAEAQSRPLREALESTLAGLEALDLKHAHNAAFAGMADRIRAALAGRAATEEVMPNAARGNLSGDTGVDTPKAPAHAMTGGDASAPRAESPRCPKCGAASIAIENSCRRCVACFHYFDSPPRADDGRIGPELTQIDEAERTLVAMNAADDGIEKRRRAELDGLIADINLAVGRYVRAFERGAGMSDEPERMRKAQMNLREWVAACFREIAREAREKAKRPEPGAWTVEEAFALMDEARADRDAFREALRKARLMLHSGTCSECAAHAAEIEALLDARALAPEPSPPRPPAPDRCGSLREDFAEKIGRELERAYAKHGRAPWGRHEFYAILLEEVDELWEAIKGDYADASVVDEMTQVAAMCFRYFETGERS